MKPAFLQTEISTGTNADDHAFFANALANPPIPAGATPAQARDVLVIQALLMIRDAGKATPAGAVAVSAWIDLANEGETRVSNPPEALALLENLKATAALYLGSTDSRDPRANPLYSDLTLFMRLGTDWDGFAVHPAAYHDAGDTVLGEQQLKFRLGERD